MFYTFRQNNSYGRFDGPVFLCVECDSLEEASEIGQRHGVYYDGSYMRDCSCCGTRWSEPYDHSDLTAEPSSYGEPLAKVAAEYRHTYEIYYKNGDIVQGSKAVKTS